MSQITNNEKTYDEVAHIIRDIYASAEARVAVIEKAVDEKIADAIGELVDSGKAWATTGKGDSVNDFTAESIFEQYVNTINNPQGIAVAKDKTTLKESAWTSTGLNPYENPNNVQTLEMLRLQQDASAFQYHNYPIAKSIIDNRLRYAIGRGCKVSCLSPEISTVLSNFWKENRMEQRIKKIAKTYEKNGEWFGLLFDNVKDNPNFDKETDTVLVLRSVSSTEIDEIECDPEDRETRLSYKRRLIKKDATVEERIYLDVTHPFGDERELKLSTTFNETESANKNLAEDTDTTRMIFFMNGDEEDLRGRPILETVLRWNRVAVDFLYSRSRLNHLRSKIYLVETWLTSSGKRPRSGVTTEQMPKGGVKLIETPDKKYRVLAPETGADGAEIDFKMILYMIGSAFSMPIHILFMNAENNNYASITEAGNPFTQSILEFQDELGEHLKCLLRYVVETAQRRGLLESEYELEYLPEDVIGEARSYILSANKKGLPLSAIAEALNTMVSPLKKKMTIKTSKIPISVTFPELITTDPLNQATAITKYLETGIYSLYAARLRAGVDPDVEDTRTALEFEQRIQKQEEMMRRLDNGQPSANPDAAPANKDKGDSNDE